MSDNADERTTVAASDETTRVKPVVAVVGRPNVGKSSLVNRIIGRREAVVEDVPGVTRDRVAYDANWQGREFTLVDTGGWETNAKGLAAMVARQAEYAAETADVILFVIDARAGVLPADRPFAELVRRSGRPVILIANKAEGGAGMAGAYDAFSLGLGDPVPLSAEHGEGMADLFDALMPHFPDPNDEEDKDEDDPGKPLQVAIVGRPNAGKSTLINHMIGEERLLTGPEAGITRDSISIDWVWRGRAIKLFDTAGLRKRARVEDKLEKLSVGDALRAVRFAEVVVILLDATIPFEKQDLSIVDLVEQEGRALVIGLNKWDLVADQKGLLADLKEKASRLLPQVRGAPVVPLSGLAGSGIDQLGGLLGGGDEARQLQHLGQRAGRVCSAHAGQ